MKLNINIIVTTLLICCCSSAKIDAYNLLIMGDQGQYEVLKNNKFDLNEEITLDKNGCKFYKKISNEEININLYDGVSALDEKNGLKNFSKIVNSEKFKTLLKNSHGIGFLGDVVYPESKGIKIDSEITLKKFINRLHCGWNVFIGTLQKIGVYSKEQLDSRVEILSGNHSYDVSINEENKILNKLISQKDSQVKNQTDIISTSEILKVDAKNSENNDKTTYINNIQLITVTGIGFSVKIIDFNSSLLVCLGTAVDYSFGELKITNDNFKECGHMKNFYQGDLPTYSQAIKYYSALKKGIEEKFTTDSNTWNVLRAHHPPINFEDGDASFYFDKAIDDSKKSLVELFEEKKINIFFGSHIHSQGIMLLPYGKNSKIVRPVKEEIEKDEGGCHYGIKDKNKINVIPNNKDQITYNPPKYYKKLSECNNLEFEINLPKDGAMIIFLNGNSGRYSDPISNGFLKRFNHGVVVWNRRYIQKNCDNYGFSHAIFKSDSVEVTFYEYDFLENLDSIEVAKATIKKFAESSPKNQIKNKRKKYLKK